MSSREEPDGEESVISSASNAISTTTSVSNSINSPVIRVPDWIMAGPTLRVLFNERADAEILELGVDKVKI